VDNAVKLRVSLRHGMFDNPIARKWIPLHGARREEVVFNLEHREPGTIKVKAVLLDKAGNPVGEARTCELHWPGRDPNYRGIEVRNNFVWTLIKQFGDDNPKEDSTTYRFHLPIDRWLRIRSAASLQEDGVLSLCLDGADEKHAIIRHERNAAGVVEAVRFVAAGNHTLTVIRDGFARVLELEVTAVPAIQYNRFPGAPDHPADLPGHDWPAVNRRVLANANTVLTTNADEKQRARLSAWRKTSGGAILALLERPPTAVEAGPDTCFDYVRDSLRKAALGPDIDGLQIGSFRPGEEAAYAVYTALVRRLAKTEGMEKLSVSPLVGPDFRPGKAADAFLLACLESGGYVCRRAPLPERPTEAEALTVLRRQVDEAPGPIRASFPNILQRTVWVLDCASFPRLRADAYPEADFNVWLDMQFHFLATHPAFFGLGGLQVQPSDAMNDELLRLVGALFQHYCVKGKTNRFLQTSYELTYLENPDFADGIAGWRLEAAAEGSIGVRSEPDYGRLQGRNGAKRDQALCLTRSAAKPNVVFQTMHGLVPGRMYAVRLITADYDELKAGKSRPATHGIAITLEHASVLSGKAKPVQFSFPSRAEVRGFSAEKPLWFNYHRVVFQARRNRAKLRLSDWDPKSGKPLGPAKQTLMLNFIEVRPYRNE
jgi:hypothetical protein